MVYKTFSILTLAFLAATTRCVLAEIGTLQFSWHARATNRVRVLNTQELGSRKKYLSSTVDLPTLLRTSLESSGVTGDVSLKTSNNMTTETDPTTLEAQSKNVDTITIGNNKFRKEQVIGIGDIDNNGFKDNIVAQPIARKNAGSIRVYLMKEKNQFLFSRELTPGNWGFEADALQEGDMFGSSVFKVPGSDSSCVVAVGAPGDNAKKMKMGAIYMLHLTRNGRVSKAKKVSADTDTSLARQHNDNEGFGSEIKAIGDLNGDGNFELAVKSLLGSTTVLFLNADHEVKTSLKVHDLNNPELVDIMEKYRPPSRPKLDAAEFTSILIRKSHPDDCFFNETSCSCGKTSLEERSSSCLKFVGTDPATGRSVCKPSDCDEEYACMCNVSKFCKRVKTTNEVPLKEESTGDGMVFCSLSSVTRFANIVQEEHS